MWISGKIPMLIEAVGASLIGVGLYLWIPAISLIWIGAVCIAFAWGISGREADNGDTN